MYIYLDDEKKKEEKKEKMMMIKKIQFLFIYEKLITITTTNKYTVLKHICSLIL